jgi:hypothetical protein
VLGFGKVTDGGFSACRVRVSLTSENRETPALRSLYLFVWNLIRPFVTELFRRVIPVTMGGFSRA